MSSCVFCQEIEQSHPNIFYWGRGWAARWDNFPVRAGHVEIISAYHRERLQDLEPAELSLMMPFVLEVMAFIERVARSSGEDSFAALYHSFWQRRGTLGELSEHLIDKALGQAQSITSIPDGWTLGMADGEAAGQNVRHLHFHIIPRWWGDIDNPRGHLRRIFPDDPFWQKEIP